MIIDYLLIWVRVRETRLSAKFTQEMLAETIYDKHGFHVLDQVLRLLIGTWEGEPNSLSANMLNGVARLVAVYGDQIKDTIFKERLSRVSISASIIDLMVPPRRSFRASWISSAVSMSYSLIRDAMMFFFPSVNGFT